MAYSSDNVGLWYNGVGGGHPRNWVYYNADGDDNSTITGSGYFSDGVTKGMKVGDLVSAQNTGTAKQKFYQVTSVSGAAATVSAITAIT